MGLWGFGVSMPLKSLGGGGVGQNGSVAGGNRMISALSVLVLGDSLGQPLQLSGLSFDILSSLEVVFFVVLPKRKQGRGMSGLSFELESLILGLALLRQGLGAGFKLLARGFWAYTLGICVWSLRVWAQTLCNSILFLDDIVYYYGLTEW